LTKGKFVREEKREGYKFYVLSSFVVGFG